MRWEIRQFNESLVNQLADELNIPRLVAKLLVLRGITNTQDARIFLSPTRSILRSPFLMRDMDKAVEILLNARELGEKVVVHGDYDVDGITGTAVLYTFLSENGWLVDYYIPKRLDNGYGVQPQFVEEAANNGVRIILTVDCGITAFEAAKRARELGIKMVITDHHEPKEVLPEADAIVNPKRVDDTYPFKGFAGVGVAYKLISALAEKLNLHPSLVDELLDLVALGTVADMVELLDENRYIVKEGLKKLNTTAKLGIIKLLQKLGIGVVSSRDIGYRIAPKLNAAGRLDSPEDAFKLIITKDDANATELVEILLGYNATRQGIEAKIYNEAVQMIESHGFHQFPIVIAYGYGWHVGVIGIVATRLVHLYNKPVMVISIENGLGRGSARSVEGVNIIELLQDFREIFEDFGGHTMALGFTIREEKIPELIEAIKKKISEKMVQTEPVVYIDEKISVEDINEDIIKAVEMLEPYGHGNPEPVFLVEKSDIERFKIFGESGYNVRLTIKGSSRSVEGVGFGLKLPPGEIFGIQPQFVKMDVVGNLRYVDNTIQMNIIDLRIHNVGYNEMVERAFISSFITNWREQKEEEYLSNDFEDDILSRLPKVADLCRLKPPVLLSFRMPYRNAFFYKLAKHGRLLIINPSSTEAMHIYESLQRHNITGLTLVNSLSRSLGQHIVTNAVCADKFELAPEQFDFVVLNEIQFLKNIDPNLYDRIVTKFGKKAFFTTVYSFETTLPYYEIDSKLDFSIEDKRNQPKSLNNSNVHLVYMFSSHSSVEAFFNHYVKKVSSRDVVFYSPQLAPFQRLIISNLVRKHKVKKLISSTNNDSIPSLFGKVEVRLFDFPYTFSEIIDAVSGDGTVLLQLNYSSQDIVKKREMLRKLFPSQDEIEKLVDELNTYLPMNLQEFETLVSSLQIPKGVVRSIYLDLGGLQGNIVHPADFSPERVVRLSERDIELGYFERYTMQLESLSVRDVYKLIDERYVYGVEI